MLYSSISQSEFLSFIFKGWAVKQHNHREQNDPATTQQLELFGRNNPVTWRAVCAVTAPDLIKCFLLVFGSWHCNSTTLSIKLCLISNIGIRQNQTVYRHYIYCFVLKGKLFDSPISSSMFWSIMPRDAISFWIQGKEQNYCRFAIYNLQS